MKKMKRAPQKFSSLSIELEQHQYILYTLLRGSFVASGFVLLILLAAFVATGSLQFGVTALGAMLVIGLFIFLYWLAKKGRVTIASFCFSLCYFLLASIMVWLWGIMLPQALLLFALAIITASLLIGRRAGLLMFALTSLSLSVTTELNQLGKVQPDLDWTTKPAGWSDVIVFVLTLLVMLVTAWLSNREIERLLMRSQRAERQLIKERDQLEVTVQERTRELRARQESEMMHLYQFAYFGRTTASFLHDMVSPASTVAMTLKRIKGGDSPELLQRAVENAERIEQYIAAARAQLHREGSVEDFSLTKEVQQVANMLKEAAQGAGVVVSVAAPADARLVGDPLKFYRLVANLVQNAVDACIEQGVADRRVSVALNAIEGGFAVQVHDTGHGIAAEVLDKVFDPFFTTKTTGQGMGLAICKEIVESDFGGTLSVESNPGQGTTFTATLYPYAK